MQASKSIVQHAHNTRVASDNVLSVLCVRLVCLGAVCMASSNNITGDDCDTQVNA
jgi:hypothetical protein